MLGKNKEKIDKEKNRNNWNPELYLKFKKERTQPSIDLVNRIEHENPKKIIDIGCGPGNSTNILVQKWGSADEITGIDYSPEMIKKAKESDPELKWKVCDIGKEEISEKYDIVFSNAVIQWIPNHKSLIKKLFNMLNDDGILAIQIPIFWDMDLGKIISEIGKSKKWKSKMEGIDDLFVFHNHNFYYDQLCNLTSDIEMWETQYMNIMESHFSMIEMMRSTGLKPYLERLDSEEEKSLFEEMVLSGIKEAYPIQEDGRVLLPFKRLFFTAKK